MGRLPHTTMHRLERMSRLRDYKLEKSAADPRGWKVFDGDGHTVGVVRDLVIDTDRMTTAFVDVELDRKLFELRDDPHILVPMRRAHREGNDRRLVVPELTRSRVAALYQARAEHEAGFWERWWQGDTRAAAETTAAVWSAGGPVAAPVADVDVRPFDDARARERPYADDESPRRRPLHPDERLTARDRDVVSDHRRFDE